MCRMAYIPKDSKLSVDELEDFFKFLEEQGGGIGSGIGWFDQDHQPQIKKGMELTARDLAVETRALLDNDLTSSGVLYHTRIPTSGGPMDFYCHPFATGKWITCFNGTWIDYESHKLQLVISSKFSNLHLNVDDVIDANDAGIIAFLIEVAGFEIVKMIPSGVILSMNHSEVFIRGNYEGFGLIEFEDGDYLFASEFPQFSRKIKNQKEVGIEAIIQLSPKIQILEGQLRSPRQFQRFKRRSIANLSSSTSSFLTQECSGNCLKCEEIEDCELYWEIELC